MEKSTINPAGLCEQTVFENECTLDEIVFQNKNKEYGAYNLRMSYLKTINRAFFTGTALFVFGLAIPTLYAKFNPKKIDKIVGIINLENLPKPPTDVPPVVIPPTPIEVPDLPTTRFLPPKIVVDELVEVEDLPPTQADLKDAPAAIETNLGEPTDITPVIDETAKIMEMVEIKPVEEDRPVFVEQQAFFIGGNSEMTKFLQKNLKYPRQASNSGISGKVFLSFIVDKNGQISDVTVLKGIGFGCDEEAVRVIKAMPNWSPGKQSGRAVKSRFNLPIVFALE
ncbi:MAG: energy transducer TonB [Bacteroidota bacterium]